MNKGDSILGFKRLQECSIDIILEDPPYKYLLNQKLEQDFDEKTHFAECYRILKDDGFLIFFGRGVSFYRWCTICSELGFIFKEEIIWDKRNNTSPVLPISRVHETIVIFSKKNGIINKTKVPYVKIKKYDMVGILEDVRFIKQGLKDTIRFDALIAFLEKDIRSIKPKRIGSNFGVACGKTFKKNGHTCVEVAQSMTKGMQEKTIILEPRPKYNAIHPTQKPVDLLKRLLNLVLPKQLNVPIKVIDGFAGSASCAEACHKLEQERQIKITWEGWEIDDEYYTKAQARIDRFPIRLFT